MELLKKKKIVLGAMTALLIFSYFNKDRLPEISKITTEALRDPIQTKIIPETKIVSYKGSQYEVELVDEYEISGVLVSTNNPTGIMDMYHDAKSFDTKDFCLVWGKNLASNDYRSVEYWNVSITCRWKFESDFRVDPNYISNNHLITDNDEIRRQISNINIGDQITLKGYLANYRKVGDKFTRKTSRTRTDTGMGACEVFFVTSIKVLQPNNPILNKMNDILVLLLPLTILAYFGFWVKDL